MSSGPKRNWGGAREGAGRPTETLSGSQVREMLQKAKERAEKEEKSIDDILLDIIYAQDGKRGETLAAIKLFKDKTMAQMKEGGETDSQGPGVYLPGERPDPAKVIPIK